MMTEEQKEKLATLRSIADMEGDKHLLDTIDQIKNRKNPIIKAPVITFKKGDKVYFGDNKGTITQVLGENKFLVISVKKEEFTLLSTQMRHRIVEDYSNVLIPENISKLSTERLLNLYKNSRRYLYSTPQETEEIIQMKAELAKRKHINSKPEKVKIKSEKEIEKLKVKVKWQKKQGKTKTKEQIKLNNLLN